MGITINHLPLMMAAHHISSSPEGGNHPSLMVVVYMYLSHPYQGGNHLPPMMVVHPSHLPRGVGINSSSINHPMTVVHLHG